MRYTWSWPWQKFALLSQKSTFIAIKYLYIYHYQVCFVNLRAKHLVDILYVYVSNEITHYYQMLLRVKYYMYLTIHIFISTMSQKGDKNSFILFNWKILWKEQWTMKMQKRGLANRKHNKALECIGGLGLKIIYLKPQDSFGRFVKIFLDLQKVDHTIRKHH